MREMVRDLGLVLFCPYVCVPMCLGASKCERLCAYVKVSMSELASMRVCVCHGGRERRK